MGKNTRRRFSKKEKRILFLAADGKSELSGEELKGDWQADHIVPWSKGGLTDLVNSQALTKTENQKKGSKMSFARVWQANCYRRWLSHNEVDYLIMAIPGSGKTIAAGYCADDFLRGQHSHRVIVVLAPTVNVQEGWQRTLKKEFGIEIAKSWEEYHRGVYAGMVLTYQALNDTVAGLLRHLSGRKELMSIGDEIHHLDEKASWGDQYQTAFELAKHRIALTGTPFRSKPGQRMPFLPVDQKKDKYIEHFSYDYPTALEDKHIRAIEFHPVEFELTKAFAGGGSKTLSSKATIISDEDADYLLRKAIYNEKFLVELLQAAHEKLKWKRQYLSDAAGLVLADDQDHAQKIVAPILKRIIGVEPDIIVSDEDRTTTTVDDFRRSNRPWLIAVNKVSEGTDIARLCVLAWLTTRKTLLIFRQGHGRIMRRRDPKMSQELWGYSYFPNHKELREYAREIEEWQQQVIGERKEKAPSQPGPKVPGPITFCFNEEAELGTLLARGTEYDEPISQEASELCERTGLDEATIAQVLDAQRTRNANPVNQNDSEPLEQRIKGKSVKLEALTRKLDGRLNTPPVFGRTNDWLVRHFGKVRKEFSEAELDEAINIVKDNLSGSLSNITG